MSFRSTLIMLLTVGVGLCIVSVTLARYTDPNWQDPFLVDISNVDREDLSKRWHAARAEALTARGTIENVGLGLVLLSLSLFGLTAAASATPLGPPQLRTPRSFLQWFGVALAATAVFVAGFIADLILGFARGEFPWWADSLAIPLMAVPPLLVVGAAASLLFALIVCRIAPDAHPITVAGTPSWLSVFLAVLVLAPIGLAMGSVVGGPTYVPALIIVVYLAASARQAVLVRARGLTSEWSGPA